MNKADKLFIMIVAVCACLLYVPLIWSAYRDAGREKEVVVSYKDREILRKSLSLNDVYTVKGTLGDVQVEVKDKRVRVEKENSPNPVSYTHLPIYASFYDTRFAAALSAALGMVCLNVSTRMTCMHVIIEPIFRQVIFRCLCAISLNRAVLLYYNVQIKGKEIICMKKILMLCLSLIHISFRINELLSRMRSVQRRYHRQEEDIVQIQYLSIYPKQGKVYREQEEVLLTALEYRLLMVFINHPQQVLSCSQLLEGIWDAAGDFVNENKLTGYIKRLREKLERDPQNPSIIVTVRGLGYRLELHHAA